MRGFGLALSAILLTGAAPAQEFVVTNRMPPAFAVTNRVPPATPPAAEPPAVLAREYHPQLGGWVLVERPAPGVAARPFRGTGLGGGYFPGHQCPACGTAQYAVAGFNGDGTHNHVCPRCGVAWRH